MARVLVIDDEKTVALVVFGLLEDAGHTPVLARSNRVVFEDLERCDYDLVLTDLNMPGVTGWEVADWIERHRPATPVIAFSGALAAPRNGDEFDRFAAVIAKDGDPDKLSRVVDEVIGTRCAA